MKTSKNLWIYGIIIFSILGLGGAIAFRIMDIGDLPSQFYGALVGTVITAVITVFLLQGQTANEEQRERSLKVFEKKQDVYHEFLNNLKQIIQDGEITIAAQGANADISGNIDELKELLFQLGYIQMHTSEENTNKVFERVSKIIQLMNDFSSEKDKQKVLPTFYAQLSEELFGIVALLKNDLYGVETKSIKRDKIEGLLRECNLFVDSEEFDKYELQRYFWDELQNQLLAKGYEFEKQDFTLDVQKYYAGTSRNRHRWFGFSILTHTTQDNEPIWFRVELENDYYYGWKKNDDDEVNPQVAEVIQSVSSTFKLSNSWYGWKYPEEERSLNFWALDSTGFERLKNPRKREALIKEIADDMALYIDAFQKIAQEKQL